MVEVTGVGSAGGVPDVVRLDVGVRCEAADVSSALADAAGRATALGDAARDHGVEPRDVQTTGAGVRPRHDREGLEVIGYAAHQTLRVTVRDPSRVGALVDAFAGAAGSRRPDRRWHIPGGRAQDGGVRTEGGCTWRARS